MNLIFISTLNLFICIVIANPSPPRPRPLIPNPKRREGQDRRIIQVRSSFRTSDPSLKPITEAERGSSQFPLSSSSQSSHASTDFLIPVSFSYGANSQGSSPSYPSKETPSSPPSPLSKEKTRAKVEIETSFESSLLSQHISKNNPFIQYNSKRVSNSSKRRNGGNGGRGRRRRRRRSSGGPLGGPFAPYSSSPSSSSLQRTSHFPYFRKTSNAFTSGSSSSSGSSSRSSSSSPTQGSSPWNHQNAPYSSTPSNAFAFANGMSSNLAHLSSVLSKESSQMSNFNPLDAKSHLNIQNQIQDRKFFSSSFKKKKRIPLIVSAPIYPPLPNPQPSFSSPYPLNFDRSKEKNRYEEAERNNQITKLDDKINKLEIVIGDLKQKEKQGIQQNQDQQDWIPIKSPYKSKKRPLLGLSSPPLPPPTTIDLDLEDLNADLPPPPIYTKTLKKKEEPKRFYFAVKTPIKTHFQPEFYISSKSNEEDYEEDEEDEDEDKPKS